METRKIRYIYGTEMDRIECAKGGTDLNIKQKQSETFTGLLREKKKNGNLLNLTRLTIINTSK